MPQAASEPVAGHGGAAATAHHEPDSCRLPARPGRRLSRPRQVQHEGAARSAPTTTAHHPEVPPAAESMRRGQHGGLGAFGSRDGLRRRDDRGPCGGGPPGSPVPPGSASAAGSRASCAGVDCSAGRCACSRVAPRRGADSGGRRCTDQHDRSTGPRRQGGLARDGHAGGSSVAASSAPVGPCSRYASGSEAVKHAHAGGETGVDNWLLRLRPPRYGGLAPAPPSALGSHRLWTTVWTGGVNRVTPRHRGSSSRIRSPHGCPR